ncbi:response regulator transcription factor [Amycolatopsis thermoflava]|uniref:DNA-binding NarL/FixJ family response regulator n=1 Tax=Amycolatopsis thermoflava TaxID=84480 RepID=A0A3N2GTG2_9PSEU|nr:response regulator transcription factor [Amycolatopsis thermoflava]ROS39904.1 DNA-binding NarL/FixJ family response regulator [Amycolatopsis thermoflava]
MSTTSAVHGRAGIRVAVADSLPLFREGLFALVRRSTTMRWAGHAGTAPDLLRLVEHAHPDVVLLGAGVNRQPQLIPLLTGVRNAVAVVVLLEPGQLNRAHLGELLRAGARGVVARAADPLRITEAIAAATRQIHVDGQLRGLLLPREVAGEEPLPVTPRPALSGREYQVLQLIAEGLSTTQIAASLLLSVETIRTHVRGVLRKLAARDRTHAVALAFRAGLLVVPGQPDGERRQAS